MDGELVVLPAPHAHRLLQRVLGELDADLLVLEQLPDRVTELGGMVKQARPGVRLTRQAHPRTGRQLGARRNPGPARHARATTR
jgi:hypothetical protein